MHLALLFATGASRTSTDFCRLSPTPAVHPKSSKCVYVRRACFDAEQIILHGRDAADSKKAIDSVLNGMKDPYSTFAMLRPWSRNTTLVAQPGATYSYLPMAINARAAAAWQKRGDASMVQHRRQQDRPAPAQLAQGDARAGLVAEGQIQRDTRPGLRIDTRPVEGVEGGLGAGRQGGEDQGQQNGGKADHGVIPSPCPRSGAG